MKWWKNKKIITLFSFLVSLSASSLLTTGYASADTVKSCYYKTDSGTLATKTTVSIMSQTQTMKEEYCKSNMFDNGSRPYWWGTREEAAKGLGVEQDNSGNGEGKGDSCTCQKKNSSGEWKPLMQYTGPDGHTYQIDDTNTCHANGGSCGGTDEEADTDKEQHDSGEDMKQDDNNSGDDASTCEQQFFGFGWVFCPLWRLISGGIGGFTDWISEKLDTNVFLTNGDTLRQASSQFIAYANILLVIIFIIMIYSMATSATSFGFSNYDIKVILPRLVVVGAAVNLSFYICAALVDLSNIAGSGVYKLICAGGACDAMSGSSQQSFLSKVVDGAANSVFVVIIAIAIFGGAAIVAFFVIIACISFRDMALAVMAIFAPIAIALYVLPNTQKWARRYFMLFVQLLIVYPAFAALIAVSRLLGSVLTNESADGGGGAPDFVIKLACDIAPALGIVPLFQASGGLIANVASKTQAQLSPYGNKLTGGVRGLEKNNPLTRRTARGISNATGKLSARYGGHGFIGRNAGRISASMGDIANANNVTEQNIKKRLEGAASTRVDNMDRADIVNALSTGSFRKKPLDNYTRDAMLDYAKENATDSDWAAILAGAKAQAKSMPSDEGAAYLKKVQRAADGADKYYGKLPDNFTDTNGSYDHTMSVIAAAMDASMQELVDATPDELTAFNSAMQNADADDQMAYGAKAKSVISDPELSRTLTGEQKTALDNAAGWAPKVAPAPATESSGNSPQPGGSTPAPQPQRFSATSNTGARMIVNNVRSTQSAVAGNVANYQDNNFGGRFANNEAVQNMARDENAYIDYVNNTLSGSDSNLDASTRQQVYNTQDEIMGRGREGENQR